jgi:D-beta-D-heptose 7-phosphate kinase/D-beta-D-heptose 1-phosphate adenosyltransferase
LFIKGLFKSLGEKKTLQKPILPTEARAELLAARGCVDTVFIFDKDNPLNAIQRLVPDLLVKGGDWAEDEIIVSDVGKKGRGRGQKD